MAEAGSTRTHAEKGRSSTPGRVRQESQPARSNGVADDILALQRSAGNRAVSQLLHSGVASAAEPNSSSNGPSKEIPQRNSHADVLNRAAQEPSQGLDQSVRVPMEQALGANLSGVRVHSGVSSRATAESLGARAYTVGSDIYLGSDAQNLDALQRNRLLAHEAVHTIQQGGRPVAIQGKMEVSNPADASEVEADRIAEATLSDNSEKGSAALALRNSMRVTAVAPRIQRDIKGDKTWKDKGKLEINFKKKDGKVATDTAREDGKITFTPDAKAPESNSIRFIQVVRTTDKSSGTEKDFVWTGSEAPRMSMMTKRDNPKNIAPGFYVDQNAGSLSKRTKKSDPRVLPFYDVTGPADPGNKIGKRKGKTIEPAVLVDKPGGPPPGRFLFVTSAKAADTGYWYGTVLWGFELFLDKGVEKIKGEYHSFRSFPGETTIAALKEFDEFYQNPGTSKAPKK